MVLTRLFHCRDRGSIPGRGTKISQAMPCSQKKKKKTWWLCLKVLSVKDVPLGLP